MPSSFVYTLPAFQDTFSPTPIPTADGFGRGLHEGTTSKSPTGPDSSSSSGTAVPAGVWFSTPHPITIQPMPTVGNNNENNNESDDDDNDCDDPVTASACTTECEESVACSARDTRTNTAATTHYPVTKTIMTGFYDIDPTPTNINYDAIASSISEAGLKYYGSLQSTTTTTVTASPTASISTITSVIVVTPTPTPVAPRAICFVHDDTLWFEFQIITNSFESDLGAALKKQESGCGALLDWKASDVIIPESHGDWMGTREYKFTLPTTIKAGCVERAIASAGGPSGLSCDEV
ncbi:uncharacterized protein Bfra_008254 [Botrytis fragariae]|uniref:Uncharacterized protein n=1 Tax=Botrytis fragariae TaxID=1964551 RepID=A0A8H6AST3_9HELO|nr:uncharacterized protein Bfra_008254 [Botrytis fragariae]KAF5872977.1 hypothetical protein Bfra_008254 [Botrytis fragariae]